MRRAILLLMLVMGAMLFACTGVVLAQSTTQEPRSGQSDGKAPLQKHDPKSAIPDRYIVVLKDDAGEPEQIANEHARKHALAVSHTYKNALKGYAAKIPAARLDEVRSNPEVQFVSEDREVNAVQEKTAPDSASSKRKGTTTEGTVSAQATEPLYNVDNVKEPTPPTGVRRIEAATDTAVHQASNANVAVIDTGIDVSHPDLKGTALDGKNCQNTTSNTAPDNNGHGTHVAGTIGAQNNGSGVVGVAPGTKLYAVKVLNSSGSGTTSQVICGIDWVTANASKLNIKVANMSLGGTGSDDRNCGNINADAEHKAICKSTKAGVTYAVAAGNSSTNLATFVPAAYDEVLTVTAMTDSDGAPGGTLASNFCRSSEKEETPASFSNYANSLLDQGHTIAGPGVCINSTWPKALGDGSGYNTISGTSMATPHLAGTAALCIGNGTTAGPCAGKTPAQIIQQLRKDAQAKSSSYGYTGDPNHSPDLVKYYGYLATDGTY